MIDIHDFDRSEETSQLPKGWAWTTLREIAEKINPGFPSGKHNKESRGIPHLRPMNVSPTGEIDLSIVKSVEVTDHETLLKGDVLFNNTNSPEWVGKTARIKQDTNWAFSNHMTRIRLRQEYINSDWIARYLHHLFLRGYFKERCTHHVNQASINSSFLADKVIIPLAPLSEQHRIIAKLEELFSDLDTGVESLRKIQAQLKRYRQAVLKAAVEGKLTAEWRVANAGKVEPVSVLLEQIRAECAKNANGKTKPLLTVNVNELLELPKGWEWATTSEVCSSVADGTHETPKYVNNGIPLVTSKNLKEYGLDFTTARNISVEDHNQIRVRSGIDKGDVLFAMIGTVGNPVVVQTQKTFSAKNVGIFRKNETVIKSEYLRFWLASWVFKRIMDEKFLKGTTQKFVPLEHLRIFPIPLPPLAEQQQIVAEVERRLSVADEVERTVDASLKQAERLRQSILKRAFAGKLVPQDPNDESAERLLERIRAARDLTVPALSGAKGLKPVRSGIRSRRKKSQ